MSKIANLKFRIKTPDKTEIFETFEEAIKELDNKLIFYKHSEITFDAIIKKEETTSGKSGDL